MIFYRVQGIQQNSLIMPDWAPYSIYATPRLLNGNQTHISGLLLLN